MTNFPGLIADIERLLVMIGRAQGSITILTGKVEIMSASVSQDVVVIKAAVTAIAADLTAILAKLTAAPGISAQDKADLDQLATDVAAVQATADAMAAPAAPAPTP